MDAIVASGILLELLGDHQIPFVIPTVACTLGGDYFVSTFLETIHKFGPKEGEALSFKYGCISRHKPASSVCVSFLQTHNLLFFSHLLKREGIFPLNLKFPPPSPNSNV